MLFRSLCFAVMVITSTYALQAVSLKPKKKTFKKASIGAVAIVPPAGKKPGSIGSVAVTKLLEQTDDAVIGLTGQVNGADIEIAAYQKGMEGVVRSWINTLTAKDAAKQEWHVVGSDAHTCFVASEQYSRYDEGYGMDLFDNTQGYLVRDGAAAVLVQRGMSDGFYRLEAECATKNTTSNDYYSKVQRGTPYYWHQNSTPDVDHGSNSIVSLGMHKVIELDQTYSYIEIKDCHIIGVICYDVDSETKERLGVNYGSTCNEESEQEYYLIDPEKGTSKRLR